MFRVTLIPVKLRKTDAGDSFFYGSIYAVVRNYQIILTDKKFDDKIVGRVFDVTDAYGDIIFDRQMVYIDGQNRIRFVAIEKIIKSLPDNFLQSHENFELFSKLCAIPSSMAEKIKMLIL